MKIVPKIYLYDSSQPDNKGVEFSDNILQGYSYSDHLDDTLDTFECTLAGLDFKEEFSPSTKFIIELHDRGAFGDTLWKKLDMVVDNDTVTKPILSENSYFDHHINFIECGVLAQKRLVDNIAVTYKLKDVSLNILPTYDINEQAPTNFSNVDVSGVFYKRFEAVSFTVDFESRIGHKFEWVFPYWYNVTIDGVQTTPEEWAQNVGLKYYQQIDEAETYKTITIPLPMLRVWCAGRNSSNSLALNGYASLDVTVTKTEIATGIQTVVKTQRVNPSRSSSSEAWQSDRIDPLATGEGWIESRPYATTQTGAHYGFILSKVAEYDDAIQNRTLTIDAEKGFVYNVNIKMHRFDPRSFDGANAPLYRDEDYNSLYDIVPRYIGYARYYYDGTSLFAQPEVEMNSSSTNEAYPSYNTEFAGVLAGTALSVYISQPAPANAYDLFNKAQLTTQDYIKEQGFTADETPKTFKMDNETDTQELKDTTIVENFYNQKNLWEIFMDIGKYIHARPVINFGDDDDFVVGWKRYGKTYATYDGSTKISIYNSRFISEYIAACSSYVANMVQLGGIITEVLPAKSNSEDYLVYNDVAEILTNKNIIEIVELNVIDINPNHSLHYKAKRGLTGNDPNVTYVQIDNEGELINTDRQNTNGFVFEENIYQLLPITPTSNTHKGVAIYYSLGTNNIKGLNYRLPTINRGDFWDNYAIKNIIGTVYQLDPSTWDNIKINDYAFEIKYRTKDTLRANQTRPDLRKYLLNSKYDKVPLHNQFNNQQDVLIDSVKFGNNVYGKLIRTGNTIITEDEWNDYLPSLKTSGDLVLKNSEWYYVAKVTHTFFSNHVISMVEFSKDFNRLSQIIGIPSEPRFYEISEQSLIVREKAINDYIVLGTTPLERNGISYIQKNGFNFIKSILFDDNAKYPKYAITIFKDDKDKPPIPGARLFHKETLHPLSCYSIQNTLTLEWDMVDNFSAGDKVVAPGGTYSGAVDQAYNTLEAVKYCNSYGRCDLIDFAIMQDIPQLDEANNSFDPDFVKALPENNFGIKANQDNYVFGNNEISNLANPKTLADGTMEYNPTNVDKGIVLLKDSRECINLNYNLQMITDSDRFVISAYLWQQDKKNIKIALLNEEVSKIVNETIPDDIIAVPNLNFTATVNEADNNIRIGVEDALRGQDLEGIKSIAIYSTGVLNSNEQKASKYFLMARNIDRLTSTSKRQDWYISCYDKNLFDKQ